MGKWDKQINNKNYDPFFKYYSWSIFHGHIDWRWFKAQAIAESNLVYDAISSVGAMGLMQIMPETWNEIKNEIILNESFDIESNIKAGIYYDKKMWDIWTTDRPKIQRLQLMFASYNAGAGNIIKSQNLAKADELEGDTWDQILVYLIDVTGKSNSEQTIDYVEKIIEIYREMTKEDIEESIYETIKKETWRTDNTKIYELDDILNKIEKEGYNVFDIKIHGKDHFVVISKLKNV